ncbi:unnamed protein product, partial [Prorocentrum cordatum]
EAPGSSPRRGFLAARAARLRRPQGAMPAPPERHREGVPPWLGSFVERFGLPAQEALAHYEAPRLLCARVQGIQGGLRWTSTLRFVRFRRGETYRCRCPSSFSPCWASRETIVATAGFYSKFCSERTP